MSLLPLWFVWACSNAALFFITVPLRIPACARLYWTITVSIAMLTKPLIGSLVSTVPGSSARFMISRKTQHLTLKQQQRNWKLAWHLSSVICIGNSDWSLKNPD